MSAHTCTSLRRECYRCDLNIDEMREVKRRDYTRTTRLWGRCGCGATWQWNGPTENVQAGYRMIHDSSCACVGAAA